MEDIKSYSLRDLTEHLQPEDAFTDQVIILEISGADTSLLHKDLFPFRFEGFSVTLIFRGEMNITMDYIPYSLKQNMVLQRANLHLMNDYSISHDCKGYHLILGGKIVRHLFEEIITVPEEYTLDKRFGPVQKLDGSDFRMLLDILERLRANIRRGEHFFQKAMILNEVRNFVMEYANIGLQEAKKQGLDFKPGHLEELVMKFIKLLVTKSREWHEVGDYSTELCVTPVYLSRTVKAVSGKAAMEWINQARITDAKTLLRKPGNTIQEVAEVLNFSDQSSFGKFFKKHIGMSPMEYKRSGAKMDN